MTVLSGAAHGRHKRFNLFDAIVILILTLFMLVIALPIYLTFVTAFLTEGSYIRQPIQFFPHQATLANFSYIIEKCNLFSCYYNSIVNTCLCVVYGLICTFTMGYGLSFRNFPGRKAIFIYMVFTMFFGGGLLPDYLLARNLGLINNRWGVILWGGVSTFNVIIVKNNIENIPQELKEAASIDGAGELRSFSSIILPLLMPTIATFTLFFAVAAWNDYFWPMLMLQSDSLRTLPLMLRTLVISDALDTSSFNASIADDLRTFSDGIKMAGVVMTMLPVMCVYPFLQKYFAKGMLVGSIKC